MPNRFNLPEILLKQPASAKLPAYRPGTVQVRAKGGPTWWGNLDTTAIPPLEGYVETRNRPGGEVVLETAEEGHPVLASWNFGAGRVTALTTEPVGPGTAGWADWKGQGELLARAIERTAADDAEPFRFRAIEEPGGALVIAEARTAGTALVPTVGLVPVGDGAGEAESLALVRVAPDRWQRHVEWDGSGPLAFEGGAEGQSAVRRFVLDGRAARELQIPSAARDALAQRLAGVGGLVPFESFRANGVRTAELTSSRVRRFVEWSPWLALLALLVYLVDIAYRRWPRATTDR